MSSWRKNLAFKFGDLVAVDVPQSYRLLHSRQDKLGIVLSATFEHGFNTCRVLMSDTQTIAILYNHELRLIDGNVTFL